MTTRPTTRLVDALVAALTALVVAGCSGTASPTTTPPAAADVAFVQGMIPHHRQAVEMSALVEGRSSSPGVRDLAARISAAQGPEIDQMTGMLDAWGVAPESMGAMTGMSGMMTPDQMQGLRALTGPAFDRAFLEMMIAHHTGAIEMGRTELAQGRSPEARALAQAIVDAQQREIDEMRGLLDRG